MTRAEKNKVPYLKCETCPHAIQETPGGLETYPEDSHPCHERRDMFCRGVYEIKLKELTNASQPTRMD